MTVCDEIRVMNRNLSDYLGVSRRDVGAGIVAGGAALLGLFLFNSLVLGEGFRHQGVISRSMFVYVSVFPVPPTAVCVSTVVWRVMLPDEPAPVRGALAGTVSAFGTLIVLGILQGVVNSLEVLLAGARSDVVSEFIIAFAVVAFWGSLFSGILIVPLGVIGGYGYERFLAEP
ncbi:hypothetical protein EXE51_08000 [Halorubrum sp. CGM5_25_10-8B]|uniref:hypothetical protein n=1 Tax=Halorubrum sp. CGM5_25_10-8B TaxID=2518115 RepID=UPI0010FA0802|nr:hypothetical protein [Halorubrum sp. CGM5_25_10-8B]TKX37013.1 hypothetical protein EXE51_08000 [Halorubrum sp. CGM5_25_10-8B]